MTRKTAVAALLAALSTLVGLLVAAPGQAVEAAAPTRIMALGDSITLGEGGSVLGVTALSWAQWLARALDLPYTCYARNGASVSDVLRDQLPRVRPGHDLACLYAGVNDVRGPGFDPAAYERDLHALRAYAGVYYLNTL